jgi:hypothetical protein
VEGVLVCECCAGLPFVEGLPCGLEGADDAFFEVGRVLLHDDDRFLEEVFLVDLFCAGGRRGCWRRKGQFWRRWPWGVFVGGGAAGGSVM